MIARRALVVVAVASAVLYLLVPPYDWPLLVLIKPIPVFALAVMVRSARRDGYGAALTLGLLLSGAGDALLEVPDRFVAGLASFLCAHVAYTVAFLRDERRWRWERAVPFAVWLLAAFLWIRPGLGEMTVPVVVYMLAIGTMMWRAAARWGDHPRAEPAVIGAVLFGLSDTLIAIDRFRAPLPGASFAIILLYWAGQAGIAASALAAADPRPA
ncbi:MAG TPA: lysoplasmalogenase [Vicinamibacteria bacterium]|nr:lysoplasmalogenase [Vicinamibacteria bacterium]